MNELDKFEYLLETAPDLFRSVLPRVIAIQRHEPFDSSLVTELVGEELTYGKQDQILIGSAPVPTGEMEKLREAGMTAIGMLHEAGAVHQDIKPSNLRMAREVDEKGEVL